MSLQVWLPLNGNLENQGLSNITITNNGATVDNNGKIGKCYKCSGDSRISFPSFNWMTMKPQNNFSFFFWVKGTTNGWLFACSAWEFRLCPGYIQIHLAGNGQYPARYTSTFDTNTWYHLGFTWSGSDGKLLLYLNGSKVAESNVPSSANYDIASTFNIPYDGPRYLNDVRIYDHCLSAKEVKELAKGLVLHYRLTGPGQENLVTSLSAGGQTSIDGTYSVHTSKTNADTYFYANLSSSLNPGDKVTVSCDVSGFSSNNYQWNFPFWSQGSGLAFWLKNGHCSQTFTVPSGATASNRIIFDDNGAINGFTRGDSIIYIKNFKVERGSVQTPWCPNPADALYDAMGYNNNIEYDCSGFKNNGTKSGNITWDIDSPRYTTSYKFNTGSDYIKTNFSETMDELSISFWVKPSSSNGGYSIICSNYNSPSGGLWLATNCEGCSVWAYRGAYMSVSGSLTNNVWHHCVYTFKNGVSKWYVDGEEKTLTQNTYTGTTMPVTDLTIGNSYTGTSWNTKRYGNLSDFRLYCTALSAEDIAELYHSAAIVDNTGKSYAYEYFEAQ